MGRKKQGKSIASNSVAQRKPNETDVFFVVFFYFVFCSGTKSQKEWVFANLAKKIVRVRIGNAKLSAVRN